jgi:hypothetical protein
VAAVHQHANGAAGILGEVHVADRIAGDCVQIEKADLARGAIRAAHGQFPTRQRGDLARQGHMADRAVAIGHQDGPPRRQRHVPRPSETRRAPHRIHPTGDAAHADAPVIALWAADGGSRPDRYPGTPGLSQRAFAWRSRINHAKCQCVRPIYSLRAESRAASHPFPAARFCPSLQALDLDPEEARVFEVRIHAVGGGVPFHQIRARFQRDGRAAPARPHGDGLVHRIRRG